MLQKTTGIILSTLKYGETSLITTIFTAQYGVQSFIMQGIRKPKSKQSRTGLIQPGMLLELEIYHHPQKNLQRIKEFHPAFFYTSLPEDIIKNSVAMFSIELLLRLLPQHAPLNTLFDFTYQYFIALDKANTNSIGNYPLFFIINCSRIMGYELLGTYSRLTPYLNLSEGGFTSNPPPDVNSVCEDDAIALNRLLQISSLETINTILISGTIRLRLISWYISFLQRHSQHMGNIKSLSVLRVILH